MNRTAFFSCAIIFFVCTSTFADSPKPIKSLDDLNLASWTELSSLLHEAVPKVLPGGKGPHDYVFEVAEMRRIRNQGTPQLWLEMTRQTKYPMVANAGFLCIQEKAPNLTFRAALETITHRKKDASVVFYYPAMKYLTHDLALNEENFDTFSSFVSDTTPAHEEMAFTLAILPDDFLRSWAERDRIRSAHPTVQAFAVDAVVRRARYNSTPIAAYAHEMLDEFHSKNGIRRAIFVTHATPDDRRLKPSIIALLKDATVSELDLVLPIETQAEYIRDHVKYHEIGLTQVRSHLVHRILSKFDEKATNKEQPQGPAPPDQLR